MRRFLVFSAFLIVLPLQLFFLFYKNDSSGLNNVAGLQTRQSDTVLNWVGIGEYQFSLFGYTSPSALVTFEGMGVFDQTTADKKGYFQFNNRFSPFSPREACLSSKDQFGRLTSPLCLPPFPVNYNVSIGPVIMPPTISLDKKDYYIGDQVILSGQAIPNTEVSLSMFGQDQGISGFFAHLPSLIKPVEAFTFPQLSSNSDSEGNFSINLPSSSAEKFRLFAQADFEKSLSPNSVKLSLSILPIWMVIIKFLLLIFSLIKSRLLEIAIIGEIIFLLHYLLGHFQRKAIILYQSNLPVIEEKNPLTVVN